MLLAVMWVMTAAMVGFSLGRVSMYGQVAFEEEGAGGDARSEEDRGVKSGNGHVRSSRKRNYQTGDAQKIAFQPDDSQELYNQTGDFQPDDSQELYNQIEDFQTNDNLSINSRTRASRPDSDHAMNGQTRDNRSEGGQAKHSNAGRSWAGSSQVRASQARNSRTDRTLRPERKVLSRRKGRRGEEESVFWSVGSPVSGEVTAQREGEQPTVIIHPDGDKLYAPAGGKITKVFPMGNAFLFSTEFGAELYIQAGEVDDELLVRHYRPRILQNEVVGKGKLLLEFDKMGLEAEGVSTEVSVSVESCAYGGNIIMNVGERVKTGEEILQVRGA